MIYIIRILLGAGDTVQSAIDELELSRWDDHERCSVTGMIIERLVHEVAASGWPYDAYDTKWALLSGKTIIDGTTPARSFRPDVFWKTGEREKGRLVKGTMKAVLVPISALPFACAEFSCNSWATNHYTVVEPLNVQRIDLVVPDDTQFLKRQWQPGDIIHTCSEHGAKMYRWLTKQPADVYVSFPSLPIRRDN